MSNDIVFNLNRTDFVFEKKRPYTIIFKATWIPGHSAQEFDLRYTGTEVYSNATLPDCQEELKNVMQDYFGPGPFDKKDIKEKLQKKSQFRVPR